MAAAIRQMEGTNPAFAANNNPGNLVYIGQAGAVPGAGGFAKFSTPAAGEAALESQIQYQVNQGQNLTQFFNQYAPGGTVNAAGGVQTSAATQNYINTVSLQLGLDPSTPLNSIQASYSGPGSVDSSSSADNSDSSDGSSFDFSSLLPSSDSTYDIGGLVLSGSDLVTLGLVAAGIVLVSAML
jgi:hypothetical protein